MAIQLKRIYKSFPDAGKFRQILEDINFTFETGKFTAVVGKSGCGKSTLLNLLCGIESPETGEIIIDNHNLSEMNERDRTLFRRRQIGIIFQFFNLIPTLSVLENVILNRSLDGRADKASIDKAKQMLRDVDLADRIHQFPDRLSGGEQQRVAVLRAIMHDPMVILADEPTGNLDNQSGKQILELLSELSQRDNKTLIMVTHSNEAMRYADSLVEIRNQQLQTLKSKLDS